MNKIILVLVLFLTLVSVLFAPNASIASLQVEPTETVVTATPNQNQKLPPRPLRQHKQKTSTVQTFANPTRVPDAGSDQGFILPDGYYGISYYASARPEIVIPSIGSQPDVTLYAPTVMPGNDSCLEATVAHWRGVGDSNTYDGMGFWDWCHNGSGGDGVGGWQNFYNFDSTFLSTYVHNVNWTVDGNAITADPTLYIRIQKVNASTCWRGYLWNWTTNVFDQKSQACGTNPNGDNTGWSIFEAYGWNNSPAGTLPPCFVFNPVNNENRHIHFRKPYVSTNTSGTINWTVLNNSLIPGYMNTNNPCILNDYWHYVDGTDPNDTNFSKYWAVVSGS